MPDAIEGRGRTYAITRRPVLAVAVCVLGFVLTTVHNTLPGAFPAMFLRGTLPLSLTQVGVLSGILYAGVMLSGPPVGRLADRIGRKTPLTVCAAVIALGTVGMALAPNYSTLLAARLLCGFGVGGAVPLLYAYLVDVLPPSWRGPSSLGMAASGGAAGFAVLFIVRATTATGPEGWRTAMWGFAALAAVTMAAFALFLERGEPAVPMAASRVASPPPASRLLADHRRAFAAIMASASCVGIVNTGFFVIVVPILLGRGISEQDALGITGIAVAGSMLSLAVAALISNRVPRYAMLSGGAVVALVGLALFAFGTGRLAATLGAAGTVFGAGLCYGAVPFYAAEVFPEHLRGRATGFVSSVLGFFAMVVPVMVAFMFEREGEAGPLLLVAAALIAIPAVLLPFGPRPVAADPA